MAPANGLLSRALLFATANSPVIRDLIYTPVTHVTTIFTTEYITEAVVKTITETRFHDAGAAKTSIGHAEVAVPSVPPVGGLLGGLAGRLPTVGHDPGVISSFLGLGVGLDAPLNLATRLIQGATTTLVTHATGVTHPESGVTQAVTVISTVSGDNAGGIMGGLVPNPGVAHTPAATQSAVQPIHPAVNAVEGITGGQLIGQNGLLTGLRNLGNLTGVSSSNVISKPADSETGSTVLGDRLGLTGVGALGGIVGSLHSGNLVGLTRNALNGLTQASGSILAGAIPAVPLPTGSLPTELLRSDLFTTAMDQVNQLSTAASHLPVTSLVDIAHGLHPLPSVNVGKPESAQDHLNNANSVIESLAGAVPGAIGSSLGNILGGGVAPEHITAAAGSIASDLANGLPTAAVKNLAENLISGVPLPVGTAILSGLGVGALPTGVVSHIAGSLAGGLPTPIASAIAEGLGNGMPYHAANNIALGMLSAIPNPTGLPDIPAHEIATSIVNAIPGATALAGNPLISLMAENIASSLVGLPTAGLPQFGIPITSATAIAGSIFSALPAVTGGVAGALFPLSSHIIEHMASSLAATQGTSLASSLPEIPGNSVLHNIPIVLPTIPGLTSISPVLPTAVSLPSIPAGVITAPGAATLPTSTTLNPASANNPVGILPVPHILDLDSVTSIVTSLPSLPVAAPPISQLPVDPSVASTISSLPQIPGAVPSIPSGLVSIAPLHSGTAPLPPLHELPAAIPPLPSIPHVVSPSSSIIAALSSLPGVPSGIPKHPALLANHVDIVVSTIPAAPGEAQTVITSIRSAVTNLAASPPVAHVTAAPSVQAPAPALVYVPASTLVQPPCSSCSTFYFTGTLYTNCGGCTSTNTPNAQGLILSTINIGGERLAPTQGSSYSNSSPLSAGSITSPRGLAPVNTGVVSPLAIGVQAGHTRSSELVQSTAIIQSTGPDGQPVFSQIQGTGRTESTGQVINTDGLATAADFGVVTLGTPASSPDTIQTLPIIGPHISAGRSEVIAHVTTVMSGHAIGTDGQPTPINQVTSTVHVTTVGELIQTGLPTGEASPGLSGLQSTPTIQGLSVPQSIDAPLSTSTPPVVPPTPVNTENQGPTAAEVADAVIPTAPCAPLNQHTNAFRLRTHVIYGAPRFQNLYVQQPLYGAAPAAPSLGPDIQTAALAYYDLGTSSVAFWHGGCQFSGLAIDLDHDLNSVSPVTVTNNVGTARMSTAWSQLVWMNDRFGSWVVCDTTGTPKLHWWDVITNQGVDGVNCAKVQLLTENYSDGQPKFCPNGCAEKI